MIKQINQYAVHRDVCLGRGGFGEVCLAYTPQGQKVACKIMTIRGLDSQVRNLIRREVQVMGEVNDQSLVRMLDHFIEGNELFIFIEYCNGGNLRNHFSKFRNKFPDFQGSRDKYEQFAMEVFWGLLSAMTYLYSKSIIHRDIKMENILIQDGKCKLADFGLSRFIRDIDGEIMTSMIGTPNYASPQILSKIVYSPKTDIWSFGVVLYEIALNHQPFRGINEGDLLKTIQTSLAKGQLQKKILTLSNPFLRFLIEHMLVYNEDQRISLKDLIEMANSFKVAHSMSPTPCLNRAETVARRPVTPKQANVLSPQKQDDRMRKQLNIIVCLTLLMGIVGYYLIK